MKVLVATHRHGLLPFAWRLKKEEHDVEVLVWRDRHEGAWEGMFDKALKGKEKSRENLTAIGELARDEGFAVMVDSNRGQEVFGSSPGLFGMFQLGDHPRSLLAVGGWFDGEEVVRGTEHLLVKDLGVFTGGQGPGLVGAATLVKAGALSQGLRDRLFPFFGTAGEILKSASFKGLFGLDLLGDGGGGLTAGRLVGGWEPVHSHAFISDLKDLGRLMGREGGETLLSNYVVALPVHTYPFPVFGAVTGVEEKVEGLTAEDLGRVFWHDFKRKGNEVWTAGLDGCVAVVRGSGFTFLQAQQKALELAAKMRVGNKQYRLDAGAQTPRVLAALEESVGG